MSADQAELPISAPSETVGLPKGTQRDDELGYGKGPRWRMGRINYPDGTHAHVTIWWDEVTRDKLTFVPCDLDEKCHLCKTWNVKCVLKHIEWMKKTG
jgi:hypothetical protein